MFIANLYLKTFIRIFYAVIVLYLLEIYLILYLFNLFIYFISLSYIYQNYIYQKFDVIFLRIVYILRFINTIFLSLKVQSCKLYNKKYVISSTQITNTETFAFIAVLVFKLLSRIVLFINRKDSGNC